MEDTGVVFGAVNQIFVEDDGYGYVTAPTVSISTSPGTDATAVRAVIMTERSGIATGQSIDRILILNPGSGYTGIPTVSVNGSGIATAGITTLGAVGIVTITSGGSGYTTTPTVVFSGPGSGTTATGEAVMVGGTISAVRLSNAGAGYTAGQNVTVTIGAATRSVLQQPSLLVTTSLMKLYLLVMLLQESKYGMQVLTL